MLYQTQTQSHSLRPLTTAHLAQTMTLLELTNAELGQKVEAELASNPALEVMEEMRCPSCHRRVSKPGVCAVCSYRAADLDAPIIFVSPSSDFQPYSGSYDLSETPAGEYTAEIEELPAFILRQIAAELSPADRSIAAHILTSLDEDGLLRTPLAEIALYHHTSMSRVERVVKMIQRAEPMGVGSANPQQALMVQLEILSETRRVPALAGQIIQQEMELLSRHAFAEISRRFKVSLVRVQEAAKFISENLNPYPARAHWGAANHTQNIRGNTIYYQPDILISRLTNAPDAPFVVEIISAYAGTLRINPLFREALAQAPENKQEQWQSSLESAALLVKCLEQRNNTLVRLMGQVVGIQKEFFLQGDAYLLPLTRAQLATELAVHESTVSRAVAGKSVQLPNKRIIPLARLFDRSLHIRTALRQLVQEESSPLSDTQLADLLIDQGYPVARRTVAKYRAMEGILPARLRQTAPAHSLP